MILFIIARKIPLTILVTVGHFFRIRSSHMNLNWLIQLQANLRPYGNEDVFGVNGVITKLKYFNCSNARMVPSILCNFERRLG